MKKLLAAVIAGMFAFSVTAPVFAADKANEKTEAKKKDTKKKTSKKKDGAKKDDMKK